MKECLGLGRILAQRVQIGAQRGGVGELHAAGDAAQERRALVAGKIVAACTCVPGPGSAPAVCCSAGRPSAPASMAPKSTWMCLAATSCAASSATGATTSTTPVAIALCGMLANSASSGAWTNTRPPASLIAWMPTAPSLPKPERITAAPSPCCSASERKNRSICVRGPGRHVKCGQVQVFVVDQQAPAGRNHIHLVGLHRHPPGHLLHRHLRAASAAVPPARCRVRARGGPPRQTSSP